MNLKHIFESTDFVHASGTKEELQVAEFLKSQCEELGVPAHLEGFRVAMGDIEEVHLLADGQEIPCKALSCCGSEWWKGSFIICREWIRFPWLVQRTKSCCWIRALDFSATMI